MSSVKIFDTVDAHNEQLISLIAVIKVFSLQQPLLGLSCFLTSPSKIQNFLGRKFEIEQKCILLAMKKKKIYNVFFPTQGVIARRLAKESLLAVL